MDELLQQYKQKAEDLERQLAEFLKRAGAEIVGDDIVFSSAGYGAWTKRKGDQRTREIAADNEQLKAWINKICAVVQPAQTVEEWGADVADIVAARLDSAQKDAFEKCKTIAQIQKLAALENLKIAGLSEADEARLSGYLHAAARIVDDIEAASKQQ